MTGAESAQNRRELPAIRRRVVIIAEARRSRRANATHWSATPAGNLGPARGAATAEATHGIVLDDQPRVVVRYTTLPALAVR